VTGDANQVVITSSLGVDTFIGVENFQFTNGTLTLAQVLALIGGGGGNTPTPGNDTLTGTATADSIDGLAGNDSIRGVGGNETLRGGLVNDSLLGGAGCAILSGGAGADLLDDGVGRDRVQYTDSATAVRVDLQNPFHNTGIATGETFFSVEDLAGSSYA